MLLNQINFASPEQSTYSNFGYIPGASYQLLPFNNMKSSQYLYQHPEYFSPSNDMRQNYLNKINNNLNIKDNSGQNFINQDLVKNLNNDNNGYSNPKEINNNSINVKNKEEEKEKNVVEDPDEFLFREQDNKNEKNSQKESESELSPVSDKNSDNERDFNDHLLAQYEKVKRVKNKWKVNLIGCVVQKDNKEYICGKIHGELEREW